jgi:hypothetical protein
MAVFRYSFLFGGNSSSKAPIRLPGWSFGVTVKIGWHQACNKPYEIVPLQLELVSHRFIRSV